MDYTLITLISLVLLILGMIGTILPVLPGLLLSFCGLLIYKLGPRIGSQYGLYYPFWIAHAPSVVLNYVIPAKTNKKFGGTSWGSISYVVGTFAGLFFIPIPFGFLIGMLLGVFTWRIIARHER